MSLEYLTPDLLEYATRVRRYLHQHPELSTKEVKTSQFIREELEKMGITVLDFPMQTGVLAEIGSTSGSLCIGLRADIDALPIMEATGLAYASNTPGVMHACGHDFHTASLLAAASILKKKEEQLKGKVRLFFQPAEELNIGGRELVARGGLKNVDLVLGFHNKPEIPCGTIGLRKGPLMASVDQFKIVIKGTGTHAAAPHQGNDPIVTACEIVLALQALRTRHISPLVPAVISVSHIEGGNTWNVIPEEVVLEGTVRTFDKETKETLYRLIHQTVRSLAGAVDQSVEIEWIGTPPVTYNDPDLTQFVIDTTQTFAPVIEPELTMGADDFANYQEVVPGTFAFIGTGQEYEWHHPAFRVNDEALGSAIAFYVENTLALFNQWRRKQDEAK